jgi:hypothetical protein
MIAATANESNGKNSQATFLKVGQNLYRNESSETYYGLTKRAGKQFRTALRMAPYACDVISIPVLRGIGAYLDEGLSS